MLIWPISLLPHASLLEVSGSIIFAAQQAWAMSLVFCCTDKTICWDEKVYWFGSMSWNVITMLCRSLRGNAKYHSLSIFACSYHKY